MFLCRGCLGRNNELNFSANPPPNNRNQHSINLFPSNDNDFYRISDIQENFLLNSGNISNNGQEQIGQNNNQEENNNNRNNLEGNNKDYGVNNKNNNNQLKNCKNMDNLIIVNENENLNDSMCSAKTISNGSLNHNNNFYEKK